MTLPGPHGIMPSSTASPGLAPLHKPTEVDRSRSQQVSLRWDDETTSARRSARLQFEVAECVETKTVTTTTTTKRSYPPLFVREPRSLHCLDSKEYPLASRPTPPELSRVTLDMADFDAERWTFDDEPSTMQVCIFCLLPQLPSLPLSHCPPRHYVTVSTVLLRTNKANKVSDRAYSPYRPRT